MGTTYNRSGFNIMSFRQEATKMVNNINREVNDVTGLNCKYLVREEINVDSVFNDVTSSSFNSYHDIIMVVKFSETSVQEADFLTKFGIQANDRASFEVNISKWKDEIPSIEKPREGDLIYIQGDPRLWEITYVDEEKALHNFYHLTYTISSQVYEYSQETDFNIDTGVGVIDDMQTTRAYAVDLTVGSGSGTYAKDEIVYQGVNLTEATARGIVIGWNPDTKVVRITDIIGTFLANQMIIGNQSSSAYLLGAVVTLSTPVADGAVFSNDLNIGDADNQSIEWNADKVIDWSESDPFSEGNY